MKISLDWIKELIEINISKEELIRLLSLRIQGGVKEVTSDYIELDLKGYNRADLLSLRGVAYEIGAITGGKIKFIEKTESEMIWKSQSLPQVNVEIQEPSLCPLYTVAKISGLKVSTSPPEWIKKLEQSGMRSVNNVVDLTNLIMLEYGQPLHAFDGRKVEGGKIIVRKAQPGEKLLTLDEKERVLDGSELLIADPKKPLGLAGVMGGKESESGPDTTEILLEAAIFAPINIRETAQKHGIPSEASKRFQHGLTKTRLFQALDAAIQEYQKLGGKLEALTFVGEYPDHRPEIALSYQKTISLIGVEINQSEIENYLTKLQFKVEKINDNEWKVKPPYYRLDIEIEEDLIEEVARMYGYEKIPAKQLEGEAPPPIDQSLFDKIWISKQKLVEIGFTEVQTYSYYSSALLQTLNLDRQKLIRVLNPMSQETEYLRDQLWPNLVEAVVKNLAFFSDIAIFELGKVYQLNEPLQEPYKIALALTNQSLHPVEELAAILKKFDKTLNIEHQQSPTGFFHPTRFYSLKREGQDIGILAEVHPRIVNSLGREARIAVAELALI